MSQEGKVRVGILGGTFDPIHNGHLTIANCVKDKAGLDKILFIPSGVPPHKKDRKVTSSKDRAEMVRLAIEGIEYFSMSTIEIDRGGYSYTIDTLKELINKYGDRVIFYFIIGADVVPELITWRNYLEVFKICEFIAVKRPGYSKETLAKDIEDMRRLGAVIHPVECPQVDVSSSKVRQFVKEGKDVSSMLPRNVLAYIKKEELYKYE